MSLLLHQYEHLVTLQLRKMSIAITAVAPVGVGTVDIRVTNIYGTSPAVPVYPNLAGDNYNDQFTFVAG
jgi:hypothetical protein